MSNLPVIDAIGFAAAGLVLATFCMRSMRALRWMAIASNLAFIAYGYLGHLAPVLLLHMRLLPVNVYRVTQLCRPRDAPAPCRHPTRATEPSADARTTLNKPLHSTSRI
jgi:hypothetical protein